MNELNPALKVERRPAVKQLSKTVKNKTQAEGSKTVSEGDKVSLSKASRTPSSRSGNSAEVRREIVEKFKSLLGDGQYQVKANEIADKMVQKIRDNKGPFVF